VHLTDWEKPKLLKIKLADQLEQPQSIDNQRKIMKKWYKRQNWQKRQGHLEIRISHCYF
jgi:hypothetical protein